jgi:prophage tail gpP-like protein
MANESDDNEVTILIDGHEFTSWASVDIDLHLDAFSSVGFTAPFEPEHRDFRDTFRPFSFKPVEVLIRDCSKRGSKPQRVFSGTLVGVTPESDAGKSMVAVTCYALPGVLQDCNLDLAEFPTEFKGLRLSDIANRITYPFNLFVESTLDDGEKFEKVQLDPEQTPFDFLSDLARQRNLVIGNTADGNVKIWQSVAPGRPVARLSDDEPPVTRVAASFNPQDYFSHITGFCEGKKHHKGSKYTVPNPRLPGVIRPRTFTFPDVTPAGLMGATRAKLSRMFGNMASYAVDVATWRDPQGDLWEPNTTLKLTAPTAMVYRESEFLIRSVSLHQEAGVSTATHGLVLPGAFSGEPPDTLPWEE